MNRRNFLKIAGLSIPIASITPAALFADKDKEQIPDEIVTPPEESVPFKRYPVYSGHIHTKELSGEEIIQLLKGVKGSVIKIVSQNIVLDYKDDTAVAVLGDEEKIVKRLFSYPNYDVYNASIPSYMRTRTYYFEIVSENGEETFRGSRPRFRKVIRH